LDCLSNPIVHTIDISVFALGTNWYFRRESINFKVWFSGTFKAMSIGEAFSDLHIGSPRRRKPERRTIVPSGQAFSKVRLLRILWVLPPLSILIILPSLTILRKKNCDAASYSNLAFNVRFKNRYTSVSCSKTVGKM